MPRPYRARPTYEQLSGAILAATKCEPMTRAQIGRAICYSGSYVYDVVDKMVAERLLLQSVNQRTYWPNPNPPEKST
jgi:hypothetical protein